MPRPDDDLTPEDAVLDRLDRIATLLEVGFSEEIAKVRTQVREDPVAAAVLDATTGAWVQSGDLKRAVGKNTKVSEKTVQRALAALLLRGAIKSRGTGPKTSYRSTGVL